MAAGAAEALHDWSGQTYTLSTILNYMRGQPIISILLRLAN